MSLSNVELVKRFYIDLLAHGRHEAVDEVLAPGYVDHELGDETSRATMAGRLRTIDSEFRNRFVAVEDLDAADDLVSVRWSGSFSRTRSASTGRETPETIEASGMSVFRIDDGKVAERWDHSAGPGLLQRLGLASGAGRGLVAIGA
jgi:predicted SnoaL-like aldol condensation-catalyzing enzyme